MRCARIVALVVASTFAIGAMTARAQCPSPTLPGGGPAATDCFVQWGGVFSLTASCVDGTECDVDGKTDGVCTFPLQAFVNASSSGCMAAPLTAAPVVKPASETGQALAAALAALDPAAPGCTAAGLAVPLRVSLAGIKPTVAKLKVTASAAGKRDSDKLKLRCDPNPTAPSFANVVQPILTARCAYSGCHDATFRGGGQNLEAGAAYQESVGARSTQSKLLRVKAGSVRSSFMARKILGQGIPGGFGGAVMPQGCPDGFPPAGGCLTDDERFTILAWIANGAPNN
jgi:hypothetical protein